MNLTFRALNKSADLSAKVHCSILKSLLDTRKERLDLVYLFLYCKAW